MVAKRVEQTQHGRGVAPLLGTDFLGHGKRLTLAAGHPRQRIQRETLGQPPRITDTHGRHIGVVGGLVGLVHIPEGRDLVRIR